MSSIKDQIIRALERAAKIRNPELEFPENETFGDYSTNVALKTGQKTGDIVTRLQKNKKLFDIVEKIDIAGPGFINFWLKKEILVNSLNNIDMPNIGKGKTVIIDYSSPNIAKPFGIGHLRSSIIGQALYNLYKFLGYEVVGDNHLGDWGTQFGKLLFMIDRTKTKDFSVENLEKLYVEFHKHPEWEEGGRKWFKKLEGGDKEAREIWQRCVDVSLKEFERIYELLGVKIDFAFGESYYESEMKQMLTDPKITEYIETGENNSKIINIPNIKTPLMFLKSDGATTYATRDLATIAFRERKWDPDIIIYEVGAEQTLYFRQLFATARLLGLVGDKVELIHTAHGLYLSPGGKKFSTRRGETVKLEEVLDEAIARARKLGNSDEVTAKAVGIGAIKYFDLMHSVGSDVTFDWDKVMNMEGNSGPYLQYTFARTQSVLAKAKTPQELQGYTLQSEEEVVLRTLFRFPEVIMAAAKNYSPNILCNYLYDLASKFNTFYNKCRILPADTTRQVSADFTWRVKLTAATGRVLKTGLNLLGIEAPERM